MPELALLGGPPTVTRPCPHDPWPPTAAVAELEELIAQRQRDISVRGNAGPVGLLEREFLAFLGRPDAFAVAFNSGTSALFAAYAAVGLGIGDEVIGPDLTYHAALSPALALGADVILADIEAGSRCIAPTAVARTVTSRTRALCVVHQWGHPADMPALLEIADRHRLRVVEDCSHAHGSALRGRLCGSFGDVAVFSLQANKAVYAGEGGILVTDDRDIYERAILVGHYRDRAQTDVRHPDRHGFWPTGYGLKLRMSPFNAIVARHSLRGFPAIRDGRHRCLRHFSRRLRDVGFLEPMEFADGVDMGAWYGFNPLVTPEFLDLVPRALLIEALRAEGLEVSAPGSRPLSDEPLYRSDRNPFHPAAAKTPSRPESTPVAHLVADRSLALPTFYDWSAHRPLVEGYVAAMCKVYEHRHALAAAQRRGR